ncbi:MAG: hypothetical protein LC667_20000, partial [Thioalkalivibrio sp.]|nr:hypothetical protein [Thioalkalivibrio sp.]
MIASSRPHLPDWSLWVAVVVTGLGLGLVSGLSLPLTAGVALVLAVTYAFWRADVKAEVLVGAYWIAFCVYETVFAFVTVEGFFYPFYAAFVAFTVIALANGRVRVRVAPTVAYVAFLVVVLLSFVGFAHAIDYGVVQRVVAYCFGLLVMVQFTSVRGLRVVWGAAIASGTAVAVWVIQTSVQGGFGYRGGVEVNQNDASLYIAIGLVPALAALVGQFVAGRLRLRSILPLTVLVGTMFYAVVLLASRGMSIGIALAFLSIAALALVRSRRTLLPILLMVVAFGGIFALPGGTSLFAR